MRCQSCEDHGFHDNRFCSCCGRPIVAGDAASAAESPHPRVVTPAAERPIPFASVPAKRCECCAGPWDGEGTLCAGCQRVFGRVLDAAARPSDVGAYHPPARPASSSTLVVVPPLVAVSVDASLEAGEAPTPPPAAALAATAAQPPRPWWEHDAAPVVPPPLPSPLPSQGTVSPDPSKLTAVLAVPSALLAPTAVAPSASSPVPAKAAPAAPRATSPGKPGRIGLAARTQRLIRAALGGIALVILLVLGVPTLQTTRSVLHTAGVTGTDTAMPPDGSSAGPVAPGGQPAASGASPGETPAVTPSAVPPSPAPSAQLTPAPPPASPLSRGAQPPSRTLRSNTKAKAAPQKVPAKNDVPAAAPTQVVVPERSVDVPPQAAPAMASVATVPVASLGQTYDAAQVDVRPRVESQVPAVVPEHLRQRAIEGVVVLRVRVSAAGQPADIQVLRKSSIDAALDAAAVAAVRKWRFSPARRRGETVNCWLNVGVPFRPDDHGGTR